ncbi:dnaJ protein ERDJ3B-like isoform X3 [Telopea speciosissima]|uniref:dnaJ protein ERDJ3B-like isoform X3 n=1 Tax=Telopea speciosissima TaxID=54955 RepID=UPI001CC3E466|nr:dnaJ protein ERDJ3B-like isoform X3 [Telopea speciosissima]
MDRKDEPHKDYYKVLEVDYDATEEKIRLNYRRLALKWHPDKHKGNSAVTTKFQEINEAYKGISYTIQRNDTYLQRAWYNPYFNMVTAANGNQ